MRWLGYLLVIIVVFMGLWLVFELLREILRIYGRADADVKLGVLTAAGSALAFVINNAVQASRERRARLFESKREAYDRFFQFLFSIFEAQRKGQEFEDENAVDNFQDFVRSVMTWGSAETVNAVNQYQQQSLAALGNFQNSFIATERLLRALRKDLGHSDNQLKNFALTKLLLKAEEHEKLV